MKRTPLRRKTKLRTASVTQKGRLVKQAARLRKKYITRRPKRDRRTPAEKVYFAWQLDQPCALTGLTRECAASMGTWIERSHVRRLKYGAGTAKKPSDWFSFPLRVEEHRKLGMGDKTWEKLNGVQEIYLLETWQRYGLDKIPAEVQALVTITPSV